ncbi:MAG: hypothetical protein GSR80_001641 [Desulfurococcales archaeon]|nr:hypothetical protein [Desulfurococcales archaeon]
MPAVGPGSLVYEVSDILKLRGTELEALAKEAVESSAVLVVAPSIVVVEGPMGPRLMSVGVGSLIFEEPPGWPSLRAYRLKRREWVDGCIASGLSSVATPEGQPVKAVGVAIAIDYRDPAALIVNGVESEALLAPEPLTREAVKAELAGRPLLGWLGDRYVVHALGGPLEERLRFMAALLPRCRRGGSP